MNEPRYANGQEEIIDGIRVIQDDDEIKKALLNGETVLHWEYGDSMSPLIKNTEYCKITPCKPQDVKRGDAVFCVLEDENGNAYPMVHQVWEISDAHHSGNLYFKIGSTMHSIFGWTDKVYGIAKGTNIFAYIYHEDVDEEEEIEEK